MSPAINGFDVTHVRTKPHLLDEHHDRSRGRDALRGYAAFQAAEFPARVLLASLIGTTIEFFDFYVYATAAVLVFPKLFFPAGNDTAALLASFAVFSIAFFARPFGAVVFGHFGDRVGRKTTLVAALLTMGISTVLIGLLPTHAQIGLAAPLLLVLCRFGQGFDLGGEWGGAVLLATENAPEGKRNWYAMFPQLGAPLGLFLSSGTFFILLHFVSPETFLSLGVARAVPRLHRADRHRPVGAPVDHRDAGIPEGHREG